MTIDQILDDVLAREGGFVHHPADRGGATNMGITQATLAAWRRRPVTVEEVRALTRDEALEIYRHQYVAAPGFAQVADPALRALLIDFGVHSGPPAAIRAIQRLVGTRPDGVLGPQTQAAIAAAEAPMLTRQLLKARGELIATILQRSPEQRVFAAGWIRRLMVFV